REQHQSIQLGPQQLTTLPPRLLGCHNGLTPPNIQDINVSLTGLTAPACITRHIKGIIAVLVDAFGATTIKIPTS
ncbi:hypothetical protein J6590_080919, partial [Homalodisca vitripennis]